MDYNTRQLEKNVRNSFALAKLDVMAASKKIENYEKVIEKLVKNQKDLLEQIKVLDRKVERLSKKDLKKKSISSPAKKSVSRSYVGAKTSMRLHDKVCPYAKNIKPKNKVAISSKAKAFNMGFTPCDCLKA